MPNIEFMMNMVKQYVNGEIERDSFTFMMDREIEKRYRLMEIENSRYAQAFYDLIYDKLYYGCEHLSDEDFKKNTIESYNDVVQRAKDNFMFVVM